MKKKRASAEDEKADAAVGGGFSENITDESTLRQKAADGNGLAMRKLGEGYSEKNNSGTEDGALKLGADRELEFVWMKRAAEAGDVPAMCRLAEMYGENGDTDNFLEWAKTAGANGSPAGYEMLGRHYLSKSENVNKSESEKNIKLASEYLEAAARSYGAECPAELYDIMGKLFLREKLAVKDEKNSECLIGNPVFGKAKGTYCIFLSQKKRGEDKKTDFDIPDEMKEKWNADYVRGVYDPPAK